MKRGTIRHPKLLQLARELGLQPYVALGLLEALLDWTFDYARCGNVGRFPNAAIATGIGWLGDPDALVTALVAARWLDACAVHRLVIHDLSDHASDTWKKSMQRQHLDFARATPPMSGQVPDLSGQCPDNVRTTSGQVPDLSAPPTPTPAPLQNTLGFAQFWLSYPKKRHKPAAERAWKRLGGDGVLEAIVAGVVRWTASDAWRRGYIEDPATFLRQRQWEDTPGKPAAQQPLRAPGRVDGPTPAETRRLLEEQGW
jgi:hypothetical protein